MNIYGLNFHLLYKKEQTYSTLDIILSIVSYLILLFISILYFKDIYNKTGFSIITNSIQLEGKTPIDLSNSSLIFGLFDFKGQIKSINNSYINFNLYKTDHNFIIGNYSINRTQHNIILERCSRENLETIFFENLQSKYNLSCIKKGQNLTIAGKYGNSFNLFDILEFHIKKCENETNNCKNEEEINTYLSNSYIHVLYLSYFVDHFNVDNPINYMIGSDDFAISLNSVKRYYYYFSPSKYISNNGLIFNFKKTYDFFEHKETILDYVDIENYSYFSSKTIMEIIFSVYPYEINYERRYVKLQDVLGNIGGCTDFLFYDFPNYFNIFFREKLYY